jgi:hypothetical protein
MSGAASDDGNDWYADAVLAKKVPTKGIVEDIRPITLSIAWKASGNTWFEKSMLDPTMTLRRALAIHGGIDASGEESIRFFISGTDVQVFYDQTPLEIWGFVNEAEQLSVLHLESTRVTLREVSGSN